MIMASMAEEPQLCKNERVSLGKNHTNKTASIPQWTGIVLGTTLLCSLPQALWSLTGAPWLPGGSAFEAPSCWFKEFLYLPQATLAEAEKQFSTEYNRSWRVFP